MDYASEMSQSLTNIQDLRTALGRLNAERPAVTQYKEGRTLYTERGGDFLDRLDLEIESRRGKARILTTGQIGVGKSSELSNFFFKKRTLRGTGFWIYCDLEKEEHPERCMATGVFLSIFRDCWSATINYFSNPQDDLIRLRNDIISKLTDWLKGEYDAEKELVNFKFGGMDYPVYLDERNKNNALSLILGKSAQHEAVSKPAERFTSAPDTLINLLNRLLNWLTNAMNGKPPVLIIDHVDKIRVSEAAEDVLVRAVPHWNRIKASIIMTAPFESTIGGLRYSVESKWGRPLMLYPIAIPELDSTAVPAIYKHIISNAGLTTLVPHESLLLFAHYCGGILRSFVQFLMDGCKEAHLQGHDMIEISDAKSVIQNAERAYQDYSTGALKQLDEIDTHKTGLGDSTYLLRSPIGILVAEPSNGEQQIRVHPLAVNALTKYRHKTRIIEKML